ncbi:MAG: hypothetical protein A2045_16910 [Rhodocyclales bacterium GWA2_65_20]|nr:MAG: hypothetical protein A2045_16910 [Rhodocyclales bacterium GWA2_65_20]
MFKSKPLAALVALACSPLALAATPVTQLDEVVVTASRSPDKVSDLPVNVSVITAADIANSTARTVQDLLSTLAGVHVLNNTGSSDAVMVDLRGFGLTGLSNTLILVDGVKQNQNDLSAPNLGNVPLAQIERIEVVRGSGAVAYGGGATGGVINIITKRGFKAVNGVQATLTAGSYDLKMLELSGNASGANVALDAYVKSMTTNNYRRNNAERNDSGGVGVTWRHENGDVHLYARSSSKDLRLPGALTEDEMATNPRGSSSSTDYSSTQSDDYGLQARHVLGNGMLYLDIAERNKDQDGVLGGANSQYLIDHSQSLRFEQPVGEHRVVIGVDHLDSRMDKKGWETNHIEQRQLGGFADVLLRPFAGNAISLGVRSQRSEDSVSGSDNVSTNQDLYAWNAGIKQAFSAEWSVFAKVGTSFRFANADEQGYVINSPLHAQTSRDSELGLSWTKGRDALGATLYRYDLENEIHYDSNAMGSGNGRNVNLDPTRRQGVELTGRLGLAANLELNGNVSLLEATFRQGAYAGNTVPLVPHHTANLGLSWQPQESSRLGLQLQHVGKARLDDDQDNQSSKRLGSYTVLNAKFSHRFNKTVSAALDVNNLTDRTYATYGGTGGWGTFYPAAGRNVQASLTVNY